MIYTAISGGRDALRTDIQCFTEYNKFKDPCLNAKIYKVMPHLFMDTEWSIWVDGNLYLKYPAEYYLSKLKGDIGVFKHPEGRTCIYAEAEECKRLNKDDHARIDEHVGRYRKAGFPENAGMGACYLIVRRHTDRVNRLNERWWAEITRGSRRDQLSFPYVFKEVVEYFDEDKSYIRTPHL